MNKSQIDGLMNEIRERYNLDFVNIGIAKGAKYYLFGGVLRDVILGRPWKEIDVRVFLDIPYPERDLAMENILKEAGVEKFTKIPFGASFTVYRFVPPNSKSKVDVDLSVISKDMSVGPDFTINGLYLNIQTLELIDPHGAIDAINKKIIQTAEDPKIQFKNEPWMMYRAVKVACQFGFEIDPRTLDGMKINSPLTPSILGSIVDKSMGGLTEWLLGNMLRGLKYNPIKFVDIWNSTGLLEQFSTFVSKQATGIKIVTKINNPFTSNKDLSFEQALNIFFSELSRGMNPSNPESVFELIIKLFEIRDPKQFEDFVIDVKHIMYCK